MAGSSALENDLLREMKKVGVKKLSREILSKCMAVITNHNLTPHDIATVWDVFAINSQAEKLTLENWSSFRVALDKEIAKTPSQTSSKKKTAAVVSRSAMGKRSSSSTAATTTHSSASPTNVSKKVRRDSSQPDMQLEQIVNGNVTSSPQKNSNGGDDSLSLALVTPPKSTSTPTSDNVVLYSTRQHAGETVLTYNPHNLSPIESNSQGSVRTCMISQPFPTHLSGSYRYMTDASRHLSLDRHLQSMTEKMIKSHGIPVSIDQGDVLEDAVDKDSEESTTFQNVGVPRQSLQTNIGRICNDAHDGKLNATSLLLEGTRHGSNGARIELDVTDVSNYCLFQGQIVAVTGVNSNGRKMVVKHVMEGLDCKGQEEDMCKSRKEVFGKEGLKVYAVAGPYTTSSDLEYQPLVDFMGLIAEEKPDVVLMMGPFVDMRQEIVKNGEDLVLECEDGTKTHVCYEQFFAAKVAAELETLYEEDPDLKTQFVLVPSMDDAVSEPVYPQPPLENPLEKVIHAFPLTEEMPYGSLGLDNIETAGGKRLSKKAKDRRVHLVPNPCTIQINEVTIGFTSLDAYMHISTESITKLPVGNRLQTLAEQFIKQRSYYPIFPASSGNGRDFNLDVTKMEAFSMPVQPDILILPSLLACTATTVAKGTTFVNPGHLVKGSYGGTYAILDIHPIKSDILENSEDEKISHSVSDRIRVEVRKI